ncbi:hypothetical protein BJ742DRAFT_501353 [Cladochytrium replicatum]|nr:hypothetical protein BJ742DRAFT_501353 [Cladochytrium replicatum]
MAEQLAVYDEIFGLNIFSAMDTSNYDSSVVPEKTPTTVDQASATDISDVNYVNDMNLSERSTLMRATITRKLSHNNQSESISSSILSSQDIQSTSDSLNISDIETGVAEDTLSIIDIDNEEVANESDEDEPTEKSLSGVVEQYITSLFEKIKSQIEKDPEGHPECYRGSPPSM